MDTDVLRGVQHRYRMVPDPRREHILTAVCRDDCPRCAVETLVEAAAAADGVIYALPKSVRTERRRKVGVHLHRALAPFRGAEEAA